jgi:preprotein translocase subunit SecF
MRLYPLRFIKDSTNIKFMSLRRFSFAFSILSSLISIMLVIVFGLNFGVDFTGGIVIEAQNHSELHIHKIRNAVNNLQFGEVTVYTYDGNRDNTNTINNNFVVKIGLGSENMKASDVLKYATDAILSAQPDAIVRKTDLVGPQVGKYLVLSGVQAMFFAFAAIMVYTWCRFELPFGLGILVALVHDVVLSLGFMSVTQLDFNLSSIAALLTIIGYSVNDSVVIYDRIRENLRKLHNTTVSKIIDISVNETLSRTTMTVMTTLIANLALILFGGEAIHSFSILVFFGIIIGTYSSIFISAPILTSFKLRNSEKS